MSKKPSAPPCPCGGAAFAACCGPFIAGAAVPTSAELLMRSRYSAYTLGDEAYLRATWHPGTRPDGPIIDPEEKLQWLGLEVKSTLRLRQRKADLPEPAAHESAAHESAAHESAAHESAAHESAAHESAALDTDSVEFVARYRLGGRAYRLHERSRFVREADGHGVLRWFYLDGSFPE